MPSPSEREPLMSDLVGLSPEAAGEAPEAFVAAVRARRRAVRARRTGAGAVVLALVAVVTAWWLGAPAGDGGAPEAAPAVAGTEGPEAVPPLRGWTLASLRRVYASGVGEGPVVLPELPGSGGEGPVERPLRLMDTRGVLADGV